MRLHHLKDKEVVAVDQRIFVQTALEVRMALADQRSPNLVRLLRRETEFRELVDLGSRRGCRS